MVSELDEREGAGMGLPSSGVDLGERRLAQWMLDVGVPSTQVTELLVATTGYVRGARVMATLEKGTRALVRRPAPAGVPSRLAS